MVGGGRPSIIFDNETNTSVDGQPAPAVTERSERFLHADL
jgi:hypothetical protein